MKIEYLIPSNKFWEDYKKADKRTQKAADSLFDKILKSGNLPPSMRAHKAHSTDYYIGYVTTTKSHWRVLFYYDDTTVTFDRLIKHDEQDIVLKELARA